MHAVSALAALLLASPTVAERKDKMDTNGLVLLLHFDEAAPPVHDRAEEDFAGLVIGARRVMNILKGQSTGDIDQRALVEAASKGLNDARSEVAAAVETAISSDDLDVAVRELLRLRKPIDTFFDDVMVMVDDERLRAARLALLAGVRDLFMRVADFAKVVLEGEEQEERQQ